MRSRTQAAVAAALVAATLAGSGCTGSAGNRPSLASTTRTGPSSSTTSPARPSRAPELLDAGAEPRRPFRLTLREGTVSTVAITTDLRVSQDAETGASVIDPPPFTQVVRVRVGAADADGADVTVRIEDVAVAQAGTDLTQAEALELTEALQPLRGLQATGRLSSLGRLRDVQFRVPKAVPAATRAQVEALPDQLGALVPTFPRQALGVGASWRSRSARSIAGIEVVQDDTVTVTAIDGDVIAYRSASTVTAGRQSVTGSEATQVTLVSSSGSGSGTGTFDLSSLKTTAAVESSSTQRLRVRGAGGPAVDVSQKVSVVTRIRDRSS